MTKNIILRSTPGKSLSEAFIFASTNPQYVYRNFFWQSEQFLSTTCSPHVLSMQFSRTIFCDNCGLVDAKIKASDIDLPVKNMTKI